MEPHGENELIFRVNNEVFSLHTDDMKMSDVKSYKEDDEYAAKYIRNLINNGSINIQDSLKIIYKIVNDNEIVIYEADKDESGPSGEKKRSEWGEQDTEILLEKYEIYMNMVGPMKKFKTKKGMWEKIAQDIEDTLDRKYTSVQVENRFKTLLKRKKDAIQHNKRSGNDRTDVPYEEQLEKIAALDDSIKPEILMSINKTRILKDQNKNDGQPVCSKSENVMPKEKAEYSLKKIVKKETKENKKKSIQEILLELHQLKEANKEKRHKERLELIKEHLKNV